MSWDDRDNIPFGRPPGSRRGSMGQALARMFSQNPMHWAVPLYTAWGIRVRMHVFFILMILFELLGTLGQSAMGLAYVAVIWASMWVLVLLHEYGHCFTCRRVGGEADEILLWPLGGLAMCRPPHDWRADLWTTVGGPAVNAALVLPLGALVMVLGGGWESVVFNPFDLNPVVAGLGGSWARIIAWSFYFTNWMLLVFNVALPMFPMDGGRILQALLWGRVGHARATRIAVRVGMVIAGALLVFAMVFNQGRLVGLAIFGGFTCWAELKRLEMMGDEQAAPWGAGPGPEARRARAESPRDRRQRASEAARAEQDEAEVNRLLDKIRDQGMQSLTGKERRFLEEATKRRRGA